MRPTICSRCGETAKGYAMIGDKRYCHPDEGDDCYTLQHWEESLGPIDEIPTIHEVMALVKSLTDRADGSLSRLFATSVLGVPDEACDRLGWAPLQHGQV